MLLLEQLKQIPDHRGIQGWFITLARRAKVQTVPQARPLWANQINQLFALLL